MEKSERQSLEKAARLGAILAMDRVGGVREIVHQFSVALREELCAAYPGINLIEDHFFDRCIAHIMIQECSEILRG
jgi:hypothetical protein